MKLLTILNHNVNILMDVSKASNLTKDIYGKYSGDGNINNNKHMNNLHFMHSNILIYFWEAAYRHTS